MDNKAESLMRADFEREHHKVAEIAYYNYEKRGFEPGYELDDWLKAESEIMKFYSLY